MDGTIWQYKAGQGWTDLGQPMPLVEAKEQYDIYMVNNEALGANGSLSQCP